ncbi:hypothetical protein WAI453_013049 [Rhynchosporium graminicola]
MRHDPSIAYVLIEVIDKAYDDDEEWLCECVRPGEWVCTKYHLRVHCQVFSQSRRMTLMNDQSWVLHHLIMVYAVTIWDNYIN